MRYYLGERIDIQVDDDEQTINYEWPKWYYWSNYHDVSVNKYEVKCKTSLQF